jgi:hypothetical protein
MRVNIYSEELTERIECVETTSREGNRFYGLRLYLSSPPELLPVERGGKHQDDDQSAVTFWFSSHLGRQEFAAQLYDRARRGVGPQP